MLLIIGVLLTAMVVIALRVRVPGGVNASPLGWMSEQWLAEHRAAHPS